MSTRCYTKAEVRALLKMSRTTFERNRAAGQMPFLEELKPRIARIVRYRADLIDRYLAGEWGRAAVTFGRRRVG